MRNYIFIDTQGIKEINIDVNQCLSKSINNSEYEGYDFKLNQNHPFIKLIFSFNESDFNQKTKELIDEIFQLISNDFEEENEQRFNSLKELERELKKNIKIDYELSVDDFS